jgi:hypothetical protein
MALEPLTELGPSNPVYPFMLLSQYRIVVCQICQYACLASEVTARLAKKHYGIDPIPVFSLQSTQPMYLEFIACRDYSFPQSKIIKLIQLDRDELQKRE